MVCGGFSCSKHSLILLNILFVLVSIILIAVAAVGRLKAIVVDLSLVGGIIACGVFLFIISVIGLVGAIKHQQVCLFFYMIILFLLFLVQFSLACACLASNSEQQETVASRGWAVAANSVKSAVQYKYNCCGFSDWKIPFNESDGHPSCQELACCQEHQDSPCCADSHGNSTEIQESECPCQRCADALGAEIQNTFRVVGGVSLFFSLTEIIGVWLAVRYRNQKDPKANPSAFL